MLVLESRECKNTGQRIWEGSENPTAPKSVEDDKSKGGFPLNLWNRMLYGLLGCSQRRDLQALCRLTDYSVYEWQQNTQMQATLRIAI